MLPDLLFSLVSYLDAELCLRYWARDKSGSWVESIETLAISFTTTPEKLEKKVSKRSVAYALHLRCPVCVRPKSAVSRSQYEPLEASSEYELGPCKDVLCRLSLDITTTAVAWNRRADIVEDALRNLKRELHPIDYLHLEPIDAFYLYCVLVASENGWYENVLPAVVSHKVRLAPTKILVETIYSRLRTLRILLPSLNSPISAFNTGDLANSAITFNTERVCWTLAVNISHDNNCEILRSLRKCLRLLSEEARRDLRVVLVEHECLGEVVSHLATRGVQVDLRVETQLRKVVRSILKNISIRGTQTLIAVVLSEPRLDKQICDSKPGDIGRLVLEALLKKLDMVLCYKSFPDINDFGSNGILVESKYLISRIFFSQILEDFL